MRYRLVTFGSLLAYTLLVVLPPILKGYVYPNIGADYAAHMDILEAVKIGAPLPDVRYYAYYIIGFPLDLVSRAFSVSKDTLFFWFNYLALLGVGLTMFVILKTMINRTAGLLGMVLVTFSSYAVLLLFYSGVVFDLINVAIILPIACYLFVRWLTGRRRIQLVGSVCLLALFAAFHSTGAYLPAVAIAFTVVFIGYMRINKQHLTLSYIITIAALNVLTIVLFVVLNPLAQDSAQQGSVIVRDATVTAEQGNIAGFPLLWKSLFYYLSPFVVALIVGALVWLPIVKFGQTVRATLFLIIIGLILVMFLPVMLFGLSPQPFRQGLDFAILLSIAAAVLSGIVIASNKRLVSVCLIIVAVAAAIPNINNWVAGYNSALERVDIQAIEYVKALPATTYSVSDNVDHTIYGRYVHKTYMRLEGAVFIDRSVSMKSKGGRLELGDVDVPEYLKVYRVQLATFDDGTIRVMVYR